MLLKNVLNGVINESEHCRRVLKRKCAKPLVLAKEDYEAFIKSTCWICEKQKISKVDAKVKDYDHINGKYQGVTHQDCNLNRTLTKVSILCFIICKIMTPIFSFRKLENIILK